MEQNHCCGNSLQAKEFVPGIRESKRSIGRKIIGRIRSFISWILPGAIFALIPKCPLCLAAYVSLWTGLGISFSLAKGVRLTLIGLFIVSCTYLIWKIIQSVNYVRNN